MVGLDSRTNTNDRIEPQGDSKGLTIRKTKGQMTKIESNLNLAEEKTLTSVLLKNKDIFTWTLVSHYFPPFH